MPARHKIAWMLQPVPRQHAAAPAQRARAVACQAAEMKALLFDCDGVILLSEDLHRVAYNAAFEHFDVRCGGERVVWSEEFYNQLQNSVGGGKPKMRWYFGQHGWPMSKVLPAAPKTEEEQAALIDALQDWKTLHYQELIASGSVPAREGVLRLMDETREAGLALGVCSASTRSSAVCVLENLLGRDRFQGLDIFLGGDDVERKKPDPSIYVMAAERLGVQPSECVVIEDSVIGVKAALGAGMRCVVTYTSSTCDQDFAGAERIIGSLGEDPPQVTLADLRKADCVQDDRVEMQVAASGAVTF
ncbi:hypothetical protein WJX81_000960 [Elliptochloris bilobata]|uniref:Uncharacterized protein n=1 Tax=Elliptochloris bilobata TaxID=381761 RepID=A0AAW1QHW9_9CHLO